MGQLPQSSGREAGALLRTLSQCEPPGRGALCAASACKTQCQGGQDHPSLLEVHPATQAKDLMGQCFDAGVNYFDNAEVYAEGARVTMQAVDL